jgi:hypothetical protein
LTKTNNLDALVDEALSNAREDREKASDAYERMKDALSAEESNLNKAMLLGGTTVKILEQLTRANEQVVRLAQIKERRESKEDSKKEKKIPIDISELLRENGDEVGDDSH